MRFCKLTTVAFLALLLGFHKTAAQDSLRLLTWNIQMLPAPAKSPGKIKRAHVIADILKTSSYDVVVFQEAFKHKSRRILRRGLKSRFPHQTQVLNKRLLSLSTNGGVLIVSRFPITRLVEIRFKERMGFEKFARKGALLAEIDVRGKPVQIIGAHLQAFGTEAILKSQYQQMYDELIHPNSRPGVPMILMGDFNTLRNLPDRIPQGIDPARVAQLSRYETMLETLKAEDGPLMGQQQYTMDRPFNDMCRQRKEARLLLDYALVRPQGAPISVRRQVRIFRRPWHPNFQDLSDHFALEAVIGGF